MNGPVQLHVAIDEGAGAALVLLHGWPQDSTMWRHIVPLLAGRFRCIALDLRGLGHSPAPPSGYEKQQLADDVLHTLELMDVHRCCVVGHDWGGVAAQLMAAAAPDRVPEAIVLDAPSLWGESKDPRQVLGLLHVPVLASPLGELLAPMLATQLLRLGGVAAGDVEHYRQMLAEPARQRASRLYYRAALLHDMPTTGRHRPPRPETPMLFLGGRSDPVIRWARGVELIDGAGHFLPDNRPALVAQRILSFFA